MARKTNVSFQINSILRALIFNPLNAELNPICRLLALLAPHHIFHVNGLRVKYYYYAGERHSIHKAKVHPCTGTEAQYRPYGP